MQLKIWKVVETDVAFVISERDVRFTFSVPKTRVQNYFIDYDPAFTYELHYFELHNGQVLCFSEVDLMITEPSIQNNDGAADIVELSQVVAETFSLLRGGPWQAESEDHDSRRTADCHYDIEYKLKIFTDLGFQPAQDFAQILKRAGCRQNRRTGTQLTKLGSHV